MMKKTRKMLSLLLALVLCMAMAAPVSAAAGSGVTEKTYHLGDSIVITVVTGPSDEMPGMKPRISGIASPTATKTFTLQDGRGSNCVINIWNDSADTAMDLTFKVSANGESYSVSEQVYANEKTNFFINDKNGDDLSGKVVTTIRAAGASSVAYTYSARQY